MSTLNMRKIPANSGYYYYYHFKQGYREAISLA